MIKESLQVACPRCGAGTGEKCVSLKSGRPGAFTHTARDFTYYGKPLSSRWLPPELKQPKPPSKLALERALCDDAAELITQVRPQVKGIIDVQDIERWQARYRKARQQ